MSEFHQGWVVGASSVFAVWLVIRMEIWLYLERQEEKRLSEDA